MTPARHPLWVRALIRLLPRAFRDRYGDELADAIASRSRGGIREAASLARLAADLRTGRPPVMPLDWRSSARYLARHRTASLAVVLTLAASFTCVLGTVGIAQSVLWRPLPFPEPERLVFVWELVPRDGGPAAARVTSSRFVSWRDDRSLFERVAAFGAAGLTIDSGEGRRTIHGLRVSHTFFDVLGARPLLGRTFEPRDAESATPRVLVLSERLWTQEFGADTSIIGRSVRFSSATYTVIGVMPALVSPGWPSNPAIVSLDADQRDFWVPIPETPQLAGNARSHVFGVVARLQHGRSVGDVNAALRGGSSASADTHAGLVAPFRDQFVREKREPLAVLLAAAVAVLLITIANIAGIQAAQFERRRAEFAVRSALGAGTGRILRQLAGEAMILTSAAAAIALAATQLFLTKIPSSLPASVPILTPPRIDGATFAAAAALAFAAAIVLSTWPSLQLSRRSPAPRGVASRGRRGIFRALVVGQVAITVGLASASFLLARSLQNLYAEDPGFALDNTLVVRLGLSTDGATEASINARTAEILSAVSAIPGVRSAAVAYDHPLAANWTQGIRLIGATPTTKELSRESELRIVSPEYFHTVSLDVLDGRAFTNDDGLARPGVAMVNESMARQIDGAAIGRRFDAGSPSSWGPQAKPEFEIIGIVKDERFRGLDAPSRPAVYLSTLQFPQPSVSMLVRTDRDPLSVSGAVRAAVARTVPGTTADRITTLDGLAAEQLAERRATTAVVSGFGLGALALAGLGLFGLMAMFVDERRREFGLRVALGATPASMAAATAGAALRPAAIGIACGIALSLASGRLLSGLLVGVDARDPLILAGVSALLLLIAGVATLAPALRASRVDPIVALKAD